jgi:hypothetical protein
MIYIYIKAINHSSVVEPLRYSMLSWQSLRDESSKFPLATFQGAMPSPRFSLLVNSIHDGGVHVQSFCVKDCFTVHVVRESSFFVAALYLGGGK